MSGDTSSSPSPGSPADPGPAAPPARRSAPGGPRGPGRARRIRGTVLFAAFLGLILAQAGTGAWLWTRAWVGGGDGASVVRFGALASHVRFGVVLWLLFAVVVARHLARVAGRPLAALAALSLLAPGFVLAMEIPQSFSVAIGGAIQAAVALACVRVVASEDRTAVLGGAAALVLVNSVAWTGLFLGLIDPSGFAGDPFGRARLVDLHALLALAGVPLLLGHALRRRVAGPGFGAMLRTPRTAAVLAGALALSVGHLAWNVAEVGESFPAEPGGVNGAAGGTAAGGPSSITLAAVPFGPDGDAPRLERGQIIPPETCGTATCHPHLYRQWSASAHRYAATDLAYTKVLALLVEEEGPAATALCARCHNPLGAALGHGDDPAPSDPVLAAVRDAGISCQYCHLVTAADAAVGNGHVTLTFEPTSLAGVGGYGEDGRPVPAHDALADRVRRDLTRHSESYRHDAAYGTDLCGACHRLTLVEGAHRAAPLVTQDLLGPWEGSPAAERDVGCIDCHMQLHVYEDDLHARPDHRTFGTLGVPGQLAGLVPAGTLAPDLVTEIERDSERWRHGDLPVSVYEQTYLSTIRSGKARAHEEFRPVEGPMSVSLAVEGDALVVRTRNRTGSHPLPSGPLDLNQLWLEVEVQAAGSGEVVRIGGLDDRGRLVPGTPRLGGTLVDADGAPVERHRLWRVAAVVDERLLPPGGEVVDRIPLPAIELAGPPGVDPILPGTARVTARWRYRRFDPDFAEWALADPIEHNPVLTLAEASTDIPVSSLIGTPERAPGTELP